VNLTCKTTRAHFEKFCAMRKQMGVSFLNSNDFGSKLSLIKLFQKDPLLESIPTKMFEPYHNAYQKIKPDITMRDSADVIKHSLIYQVIGATPEFVD
jgi:hypothetical protein